MSREAILYLLRKYRLKPDDRASQNFLVSDDILGETLRAAGVRASDRILEIGSGIGTLTSRLAATGAKVLAVEQDRQFMQVLSDIAKVNTNLEIVNEDILQVAFEVLASKLGITETDAAYKIVANLPYHITSRTLARILAYPVKPSCIVFMVQKEVAERIVARSGGHTKLSLSVAYYGTPDIVRVVDRGSFYPVPAVDSALLRIQDLHAWPHGVSEKRTWQMITFGFSSKRKKLVNNLSAGLQLDKAAVMHILEKAGVDSSARAEDLRPADWPRITEFVGT